MVALLASYRGRHFQSSAWNSSNDAVSPAVDWSQGDLGSCGLLMPKKRPRRKRLVCCRILMSFWSLQKKPYSSVTVSIEHLTGEHYEEDDLSGIPGLVEAVKIQATGPSEAARAIRKKLKYGNTHRQLRALTILDGLIQNAGPRFQRAFADEPLLERLRVCGTSRLSDPEVRKKCKVLFASWSQEHSNTPGLERIAGLYKQLPRRKQTVTQEQSKVLRETEENPFLGDEEEDGEKWPGPSSQTAQSSSKSSPVAKQSSSTSTSQSLPTKAKKEKENRKKSGKKKAKPFNLEHEKDNMSQAIAGSSLASTNLLNALQLINREHQRVSENEDAMKRFEQCKQLRRRILYYIQHVEAEQWLGGLIHANDELVTALMTFEHLDRSVDADSDSEDEVLLSALRNEPAPSAKDPEREDVSQSMAGLTIEKHNGGRPAPPPPPPHPRERGKEEEEDEEDPFADRNAVETPLAEKTEPQWLL